VSTRGQDNSFAKHQVPKPVTHVPPVFNIEPFILSKAVTITLFTTHYSDCYQHSFIVLNPYQLIQKMETYKILESDREQGIRLLFELYAGQLLCYATKNWKTCEANARELIYKTFHKVADHISEYTFETEKAFGSFVFRFFINNLHETLSTLPSQPTKKEIGLVDKAFQSSDQRLCNGVASQTIALFQLY